MVGDGGVETISVSTLDGEERKSYLPVMATQTIKEIIEDRGGYVAVAAALSTPKRKVPKTTVHTWVRTNTIPWWREPAVLAIPKAAKAKRGKAS